MNPETEATVRAVDYQVVGATAPEQFRVYSDDERDIARWRRVETLGVTVTPDQSGRIVSPKPGDARVVALWEHLTAWKRT